MTNFSRNTPTVVSGGSLVVKAEQSKNKLQRASALELIEQTVGGLGAVDRMRTAGALSKMARESAIDLARVTKREIVKTISFELELTGSKTRDALMLAHESETGEMKFQLADMVTAEIDRIDSGVFEFSLAQTMRRKREETQLAEARDAGRISSDDYFDLERRSAERHARALDRLEETVTLISDRLTRRVRELLDVQKS